MPLSRGAAVLLVAVVIQLRQRVSRAVGLKTKLQVPGRVVVPRCKSDVAVDNHAGTVECHIVGLIVAHAVLVAAGRCPRAHWNEHAENERQFHDAASLAGLIMWKMNDSIEMK